MIIACATFEQKFTVRAHTFDTKQVLSIVTKFMMVLGSHGFSGSGRICLGSPQCLPSLSLDACQAACECISIDNPGCCEWRIGGLTKIWLFYFITNDKKNFFIWFVTHHMPFCAFTTDNYFNIFRDWCFQTLLTSFPALILNEFILICTGQCN